jgi:hypothetical protein
MDMVGITVVNTLIHIIKLNTLCIYFKLCCSEYDNDKMVRKLVTLQTINGFMFNLKGMLPCTRNTVWRLSPNIVVGYLYNEFTNPDRA